MISAKIRRQLQQVDWDFSEHLPGTSKTIHWYPGTFPADIPTTIIQALSRPGDIVFDPYGGTGTTALEAIRQARRAYLTEANPVGCLSSYVAGAALLLKGASPMMLARACAELRGILNRVDKTEKFQFSLETDLDIGPCVDEILSHLIYPEPEAFYSFFRREPDLGSLERWFEASTLAEILLLLKEFSSDALSGFCRLLGKTMLSAILRPASSQTQSWGHLADNVWPKEFLRKDVIRLAQSWLSRFESTIERTEVQPVTINAGIRLWVAGHNWSQPGRPYGFPKPQASLLVTSPPYAGAIDYTLAQRLSLYAFGFNDADLSDFWRTEFGARRKRNQPGSMARWAQDLAHALHAQLELMGENSFCAFVLPHKDAGRDVGAQVMDATMSSEGWSKVIEVDRSIRQKRARQSWTSITRETIHVFGK